MESATATKLSADNYHLQKLEDEKKARKIREMNDSAQELIDVKIAQNLDGGATKEFDPTLRDHEADARDAAIERRRNAAAMNTLAGKTLEAGEEDFRKGRVREFESTLAETMNIFGQAEPENRDYLDDTTSRWKGRPIALCRARYIGNECWNANRAIVKIQDNLARLADTLAWRLKRFDGAEVDDVKIQNDLEFGQSLTVQLDSWTDFMLAACNIHMEETDEQWKPMADTIGGKQKTQAATDAMALVKRWSKQKKTA